MQIMLPFNSPKLVDLTLVLLIIGLCATLLGCFGNLYRPQSHPDTPGSSITAKQPEIVFKLRRERDKTPTEMPQLDWIAGMLDISERQLALREMGETLGQQMNLELAIQALWTLSEPDDQVVFVGGCVLAFLESNNPILAAQLIMQSDNAQLIFDNISMIGNVWGAIDPDAALQWATDLPHPQMTNLAYNEIVLNWASNDLGGAYNWVVQLPDSQVKNELLVVVGRALSQNDPIAAAQWALHFDDKKVQSEIMLAAVRKWAVQDLTAAIDWTSQLPAGTTRDMSISAVAKKLAESNSAEAINLVYNAVSPESLDNVLYEVNSILERQE